MSALVLIVVLLLAVPATTSAVTVSVQPYVERPDPNDPTEGFGSCGRYQMCPPDMVVVTAGPNENNGVVITTEGSGPAEGTRPRYRYVVSDRAQMQVGPGCTQVDFFTAVCTAGIVGPVRLGDGDDSFAASSAARDVHGGAGQDVLHDIGGPMTGGAGDDVIVGREGTGGGGNDVLMVESGSGGPGDDVLRCFPRDRSCFLRGGPGGDLLTGGVSPDRIFGGRGADVIDCGAGRGDRAVADRRDTVRRCERAGMAHLNGIPLRVAPVAAAMARATGSAAAVGP
jgi:hypothetical protein